jgi:hypothetical protein
MYEEAMPAVTTANFAEEYEKLAARHEELEAENEKLREQGEALPL